jgi:3',5'-nucleoside bisphosphate phosphatase
LPILRVDLHVHTVLSPCADIEMIPPLIVQRALDQGIHLIAITDHNSSANIAAVQQAAEGTGLTVLPGMELQTAEEVHVLCLFDTLEQVQAFQTLVDAALPPLENNIDYFGEQFVVDSTGDFIRREERMLLNSTSLNLGEAWENVTALNGLLIPAHVTRKAFGLLPVLGFVPPETPIQILEISTHIQPEQAYMQYPQIRGYPLIQNGDAHFLEDIRGLNQVSIEYPTLSELRKAFLQRDGRTHLILTN